jgi:hypothetical protein
MVDVNMGTAVYAVRLNDKGVVECASMDGRACITFRKGSSCTTVPAYTKTVTCQKTSCKTAGHWCSLAEAAVAKKVPVG